MTGSPGREAAAGARLSLAEARRVAASLLQAAGAAAETSASVAGHLVSADAAGYASHGLSLLPIYVGDLRAGRIDASAAGRWVRGSGPILILDGQRGFGAPVAERGLERAFAEAGRAGLSLLAIRDVHHLGRVGAFAESAAEAGLASLHFCNVVGREPIVAPAGGRAPRLSTNPIAIGVPRRDGPAVVLDIATSGIALNKARVAHLRGERVPPGYVVDADGRDTTDPGVLFRDPPGSLLPFGGHKGSGLAILTELLAGAVTGGETMAPSHARCGSVLNNMLSVLIDPGHLGGAGWIAEAEAMIAYLRDCPSLDPSQPVMLPGEPEAESRARAERDGLAYDPATWATLRTLAEELGVPVPVGG